MFVASLVAAFLEVCISRERKGAGVRLGARQCRAAMDLSLDCVRVISTPSWHISESMDGRIKFKPSRLYGRGK